MSPSRYVSSLLMNLTAPLSRQNISLLMIPLMNIIRHSVLLLWIHGTRTDPRTITTHCSHLTIPTSSRSR